MTLHRGYTYEQIGEMTMPQIRNEFLGGKSVRSIPTIDPDELDEFLSEFR